MARRPIRCDMPMPALLVLTAFLQLVFNAAIAGPLWWMAIDRPNTMQNALRMAVIAFATHESVSAFVAIVGTISVLAKHVRLARLYAWFLLCLFGSYLVIGLFYLITYMIDAKHKSLLCTHGSKNKKVIWECNSRLNSPEDTATGIIIPLFCIAAGPYLMALMVIGPYSKKLQAEEGERTMDLMMTLSAGFKYEQFDAADEPLNTPSQPPLIYAYSDTPHSFGNLA